MCVSAYLNRLKYLESLKMGAEQSSQLGSDGVERRSTVNFFINGEEFNITREKDKIYPKCRLVDFIRNRRRQRGTKYMCREGGCGACVVIMKAKNLNTGEEMIRAVNSCLVPVYSCDGWDITTIESLGSTKTALHPIQERMVKFSGTQCGFCTSGWIMNMHGLMQSKKNVTSKDIEDSMDGNICRCTGYRPIFDALKSLASDASEELKRKCGTLKGCEGCACDKSEAAIEQAREAKEFEDESFETNFESTPIHLELTSGEQWAKAIDINTLFMALQQYQSQGFKIRLVAGNTGTGVYKNDGPYDAYIDISRVAPLSKITVVPGSVILGSTVTLTEAIEALRKASEMTGYEYCKEICKHWQRVANTPVRNAGTLAGNLMLKHAHLEFPSDVFLVLETIGGMITVASAPNLQRMYTPQEFLKLNMMGKVIYSIRFPQLMGHTFRSFKITRRYQNAHAYVNAGFLFQIDMKRSYTIKEKPNIVYGGISPEFIHASATETFFVGKSLNQNTIQGAMDSLDKEIQPEAEPRDADPMYRKMLAKALLYKFMLGIMADTVDGKLKTGGMDIERGLTYGKQTFDTDKSEWPLYEPMPKVEAPIQCTGEAEYTNDIHPQLGELNAAFVYTTVANATLGSVDASEALKVPGVIDFITAKDIPGLNNFMVGVDGDKPDVIFVQEKISHAGQPVGLIVAETHQLAIDAVPMVKVNYQNVQKPIMDIKSAIAKLEHENKLHECIQKIVTGPKYEEAIRLGDAPHNIKGEFKVGSQYHFQIEPQTCICIPTEDGMDVHAATQWMQHTQNAVAFALGLPINAVNVQVRRLGGAFGSKISRTAQMVSACAVAANKLKAPVRMVMDIEPMMSVLGKRLPYHFKYDVGFDDTGKIKNLKIEIFCDTGCTQNEPTIIFAVLLSQNCYEGNNWQVIPGQVTTNTTPNTYCRAPGSPQGIGNIETIMERIAFHLKKDSWEIRQANFIQKGDPIIAMPDSKFEGDNLLPSMMEELKVSADLDERKKFIATFNQTNRWKKRGMGLLPMRYPVHYWFSGFNIFLAVYAGDGTVAISHSGIEMGQGINTKVVQVVARELRIPIGKIKVKPVRSLTAANTSFTAAAVTSEHICYAALKACEILNERLAPVKESLKDPSWEALIAEANKIGMDLTSYYNTTYKDKLKDYDIWGLTAAEVEIDCLTGEYKIVRVDMIHDAGQSLSPDVDIGQTEGAFVMGLGLWLTEKIIHDPESGQLLTNRTWDYKPPASKDIPEDFRITLLKNNANPYGVLRSKATGEAPLCMSFAIVLAMRNAITAAREDAGNTEWFQMDGPVTPEDIQRFCLTDANQFIV